MRINIQNLFRLIIQSAASSKLRLNKICDYQFLAHFEQGTKKNLLSKSLSKTFLNRKEKLLK